MDENQSISADVPVSDSSSADVSTPAPDVAQGSDTGSSVDGVNSEASNTEKMLTQSQVNKLIAREKRDAAAKAVQAYEAQYQQRMASQPQDGQGQPSNQDFDRKVREASFRMFQERQAQEIANNFESKIRDAINQDPDFADDYDALNIAAHPGVVVLTSQLDNTADVIRDLARNPAKFSTVLNLINSGSPELAKRELRNLSQSIKQNRSASEAKKAPPPLSQIKSSNVVTGDGRPSVSGFRSSPKFKG